MMTHPLTDELTENISSFYLSDMGETGEGIRQDMRAAADWQLEQVIAWLDNSDPFYSICDDPQETAQLLKKAMRPQVVDLPQSNSDVCGEEGIERARQRTFEENDELMRLLADS